MSATSTLLINPPIGEDTMHPKFDPIVIPDTNLYDYLEGKLTTKPDYGYDTELTGTITSREVEARVAELENRKAANKRIRPR